MPRNTPRNTSQNILRNRPKDNRRDNRGGNFGKGQHKNPHANAGQRASAGQHAQFWNREYQTSEHLALSSEPSEDLEKFCRWQEREFGRALLNPLTNVLDLGCGNGRNLIYLARQYGCRGVGYDISEEAIVQAEEMAVAVSAGTNVSGTTDSASGLPLEFAVQSIAVPLPAADASANLVLDMMSSHFLRQAEREHLLAEILRVLKSGGWLFFKGFLLDEDLNAKRMLREHPADEPDTYIHPRLGVAEHVWTEASLRAFFEPHFEIHKLEKSHRHILHGRAFKRRTISAYLQKR